MIESTRFQWNDLRHIDGFLPFGWVLVIIVVFVCWPAVLWESVKYRKASRTATSA